MRIKINKNVFKQTRKKPSKQKEKIVYNTEIDEKIKPKIEEKLKRDIYLNVKKNKIIALILRKNKSAVLCYVPMSVKSFSVDGNTYFNVQSGSYLLPRRIVIAVYLEGCVLPLEHSYIRYEKRFTLLTDKTGKAVKELSEDIPKTVCDSLPKDMKGNPIRSNGYIVKKILEKIKGLEFDSVIANAIYDSGLIEKVSHGDRVEKWTFFLFILVMINLILTVGCIVSTRV